MLLNVLGFQLGWFACVLGAAYGYPLLGPLVAVPVIGLHLLGQTDKIGELALLVVACLVGSLYDQTLMWFDLVRYSASIWSPAWLPIWMITLWLLFATTLNVSLRWLQGRYLLAAVFGFVGGPLAYWGGAKLGAIQWLQHEALLLSLALGWALLMPILVRLAATLRHRPTRKALAHV